MNLGGTSHHRAKNEVSVASVRPVNLDPATQANMWLLRAHYRHTCYLKTIIFLNYCTRPLCTAFMCSSLYALSQIHTLNFRKKAAS